MPSKLVSARQKSANAVIESVNTNAPLIGPLLDALFASVSSQGAAFKHADLLRQQAALLAKRSTEMIAADEIDIQEGLDDAEPIRRRDQEAQALYEKIIALRRTINGVYGETFVRALGISGEISRDPLSLSRLASDIINAAEKVSPPAPIIVGVSIDLNAATNSLSSARLDAALADVARELREGQQTLSIKNAAIEQYDQTFSAIVPLLVSFYRLAGKPDLADKIRPATRRPGVIAALPEETPA